MWPSLRNDWRSVVSNARQIRLKFNLLKLSVCVCAPPRISNFHLVQDQIFFEWLDVNEQVQGVESSRRHLFSESKQLEETLLK